MPITLNEWFHVITESYLFFDGVLVDEFGSVLPNFGVWLYGQSSNQHYAHLWIRPDCVHTRNECMGFNTNQGGALPGASVPITLNEWHHIAHVITADSQSYLFFDGVLVDESAIKQAP